MRVRPDLAWMMNMPFVRLAYNESSEPDQFLGVAAVRRHRRRWTRRPGKRSSGRTSSRASCRRTGMEPCVLLSDEINLPTEAIQQAYRSGNDSSRILQVYGNTYRRHDYCFHLAALNPAHDFRNIGAKPMASADSSRYVFHHMPNPSAGHDPQGLDHHGRALGS